MVKPFQVLLTLIAVGALCAATMYVFPEDGLKISEDITLEFPNYKSFFAEDSIVAINVDSLLDSYEEEIDSTQIKDSIQRFELVERKKLLNLQFAQGAHFLPHFYQSLIDLQNGKRNKVRVLHYGDSQIEGDRITSFIREKFQAEFGGTGPGMLPLMQFIPNISISQEQSENWLRYTIFGRKDTTVEHNKFGLRGIFSRFTPYSKDTNYAALPIVKAWVELSPSRLGYGHVKHYRHLRMHYGNVKTPVVMKIVVDDAFEFIDTLKPNLGSALYTRNFEATPQKLRITFSSKVSPDFYAVSLESYSGVVIDNVAMRGSSGTIFSKISASQLSSQYGKEPISLVLLQYGGNTVPYIDSQKEAEDYGRWFGAQIAYLKRMLPNADIVLIGPSDMAIKVKTDYVTYPFLPQVRNQLKKAAFDNGAAFWDIFEVMGGRNSMPSWVDADPPLAGTDYVHFTPRGARRIAELFYKALYKDYTAFVKNEEAKKKAKLAADSAKISVDSVQSIP